MIECPHCKLNADKSSNAGKAHKHTDEERKEAITEYKVWHDTARIHTKEETDEFFKKLGIYTSVK